MNDEQLSKRLAYLLRHAPDQAGITLEPGGWAPLAPLLAHLRVSRARVEQVVAADRKGRYVLRGDRIRANQGHSVAVDLHLTLTRPPQTLYHGTHTGALDAIRREGLIRIPLHSCTVGKAPPVHPYRVTRIFSYSHPLCCAALQVGLNLKLPDSIGIRIKPVSRHHVHLSADTATARQVGARRGQAVVLAVSAGAMREAGHDFFRSDNGVWLTDGVPPEFISFP